MQLLPAAIDAPVSELVVYGFPVREIMREQAPRTATLEYVEDSIEDLAGMVESRPTGSLDRR